jgi:HK97 family phage major capsid protein|nr:MAG TPA: major capsid protein [Caudoviricetes sp.]
MNEKKLIEERNEKVTKMEGILNKAKAENRVPTAEEKAEFDALEKEVKGIDDTLAMSNAVSSLGLKPVPATDPTASMSVEDREAKQFANMIRGIVNADQPTTVADGQVTIPTTIASRIIDAVVEICPIYELADRYNIKGNIVLPKYDATNSSLAMTYADEGTTAESGKVKLTSIELKGFLGRALAKISKSLINNSEFDIVGFVIDKMAQAIAVFIEGELLHGTPNKIEGLSGVDATMTITSASTTAITTDELMDVQDLVIDKYQSNSIWIMNRATRNALRKLKDNDGDYLLNRDLSAKWGYTLLGKDVYCSDAMDVVGAGKTVIYYGDFSGLAVKVSEDINMQVLNERYAEEHMTGVLAFVEMDSKVADTQKISKLAIKTA